MDKKDYSTLKAELNMNASASPVISKALVAIHELEARCQYLTDIKEKWKRISDKEGDEITDLLQANAQLGEALEKRNELIRNMRDNFQDYFNKSQARMDQMADGLDQIIKMEPIAHGWAVHAVAVAKNARFSELDAQIRPFIKLTWSEKCKFVIGYIGKMLSTIRNTVSRTSPSGSN